MRSAHRQGRSSVRLAFAARRHHAVDDIALHFPCRRSSRIISSFDATVVTIFAGIIGRFIDGTLPHAAQARRLT